MKSSYNFLGRGIYTLTEAAVLSGISTTKISRWIRGYGHGTGAKTSRSEAIFTHDFQEISGRTALSFLDLIEIQFVDWFREHGVSWKSIRIAADRAAHILDSSHPFAKRRFFTDGKTILARITEEYREPDLIDLVRQQYEMDEIVSPVLYASLDFNGTDVAERWWPRGREQGIVVDPNLCFGKPTLERYGIPTRVLADSFRSVRSESEVADWFEIDVDAVRVALSFERVALVA